MPKIRMWLLLGIAGSLLACNGFVVGSSPPASVEVIVVEEDVIEVEDTIEVVPVVVATEGATLLEDEPAPTETVVAEVAAVEENTMAEETVVTEEAMAEEVVEEVVTEEVVAEVEGPTPEQLQLLQEMTVLGQPPELNNEVWLNSDPLKLAELHGKVVIIEFWTFG